MGSVSNMFGAHGLELLSTVLKAGGRTDNATAFAAAAASLKKNIKAKMWNGTAFCDGVCSEVGGHSLVMTNMFSLCFGDDNLAMTRESWHDGTYSHQWGTSPIVGVVQGLMGVHQTAPGFATFTVKPKLSTLAHATITVPSLRGYINVTAGPGRVDVHVPCSTRATVCLPRSAVDSPNMWTPSASSLFLDGAEVEAVASGGHLCATSPIGCGPGGAPRSLTSRPKL